MFKIYNDVFFLTIQYNTIQILITLPGQLIKQAANELFRSHQDVYG